MLQEERQLQLSDGKVFLEMSPENVATVKSGQEAVDRVIEIISIQAEEVATHPFLLTFQGRRVFA